jgi:hypothetical protein
LAADFMAELDNLLQDHLSHLRHIIDHLEGEVERGWANRLVACVVPDAEVWVFKRLLDVYAAGRVKGEHLVQKVERIRVRIGEETLERDFGHEWEVADVFLRAGRADAGECFLVGSAEEVQDLVELVDVVAAFEEGTATEQLGEDAADGPDIDCPGASVCTGKTLECMTWRMQMRETHWLWCNSKSST